MNILDHNGIGKRIQERRVELGISASDLASRLGMSRATVHRWENGDIRNIKMPVVDSVARELNVNPLWLLLKSDVKERADYSQVKPDLNHIMRDFSDFMRDDGVMCCGKPMTREDCAAFATMIESVHEILVGKYGRC
ncbi:MAG: helix-turn-helix domain-containing protein [Candidatus Fimadaptatus sp.]